MTNEQKYKTADERWTAFNAIRMYRGWGHHVPQDTPKAKRDECYALLCWLEEEAEDTLPDKITPITSIDGWGVRE